MNRASSQRGFALLIVLWTLAFLALIGAALVATSRQDTQRARNLVDGASAEAAADGAVQQAIYSLIDPSARRWRPDGITHIIKSGQNVIEVRIDDENGKVNPNFAPVELMQALMVELGASSALAARLSAAISDWRTQGEQPLPLGAKAPQYAAAGRDYAPPNASFESLDELGAVLGMTPELLNRLRPHLTLYSESDPDGSTTDPIVAVALGPRARVLAPPKNTADNSLVATITVVVRGPRRTGFAERVVVRTNALDGIRRHEILQREPISVAG